MGPMPGIGDTLREARMRQDLDIADVETRTKIRAKYLRALENEEFGTLPGSTFVKTFLRTYAEVLGLDPHRLVEEYRAGYEARDEAEQPALGPPAASTRDRERRGLPGPPGPAAIALFALVAVVGLLLVLGLTGGEDGAGEQDRTETVRRQRTQTERAKPKPKPSSVTLQVVTTVPTYACVDRGEGTGILFQGTLEGTRSFRGRRLRVNLGKTSVRLRVNGKPVVLQPGPNPAGFEFTPKGRRELPLGKRPCA